MRTKEPKLNLRFTDIIYDRYTDTWICDWWGWTPGFYLHRRVCPNSKMVWC